MRVLKREEAIVEFLDFIKKCHEIYSKEKIFMGNREYKNVLPAGGKNIGAFDIPILTNNGFGEITEYLDHRYIDPGNIFYPYFGSNVSLSKINKFIGKKDSVNHRALDDAKDVCEAIKFIVDKTLSTQRNPPLFHPFVSIDTETTGLLKENPYVLEIGAVFEHFGYFDDLKMEFNVLVDNGDLDPARCGEFAMNLNKGILETIRTNRK